MLIVIPAPLLRAQATAIIGTGAALIAGAAQLHGSGAAVPSVIGTGVLAAGAAQSHGVGGVATWNPSDKSTSATLSNGNLTMTSSGGAQGARSTISRTSGKLYFEVTFTCTAIGSATSSGCGIAASTATLTSLWAGTVAWCQLSNGHIWINNVDQGAGSAIGTPASGNTFCVAVDFTNLKIWFRLNNGNWNNSGSANPSTNVGGISISLFSGVAAFVSGSVQGIANFVTDTINCGSSAFSYPVPSGYSSWAAG
jgi:hypothetical protein